MISEAGVAELIQRLDNVNADVVQRNSKTQTIGKKCEHKSQMEIDCMHPITDRIEL